MDDTKRIVFGYHNLTAAAMENVKKRIADEKLPIKVRMQIHDEVVFEVPKDKLAEYTKLVSEMMKVEIFRLQW